MRLLAIAVLAAACGDNGGHGADGAPRDAFAPADARVCPPNPLGAWRYLEGPLDPFPVVALDGIGTPCEQALRAIPQLAAIDPDVDVLLAVPHDTFCSEGESTAYVVMSAPAVVNGIPVLVDAWLAHFTVFPDGSTYFGGYFLDAAYADPACLDPVALRLAMLGHAVPYYNCQAWHAYVTAAGDTFEVSDDEAYWVMTPNTSFPEVHRVRSVDITLLPAHVDPTLRNTSLDCCNGAAPLGCVGARAWVDTSTAEIVELISTCSFSCD